MINSTVASLKNNTKFQEVKALVVNITEEAFFQYLNNTTGLGELVQTSEEMDHSVWERIKDMFTRNSSNASNSTSSSSSSSSTDSSRDSAEVEDTI